MRVGRIAREHELFEAQEAARVGRVVDAHAVLFLHDGALVLEVLLAHVEPAHAIGLEPEQEFELAGGHHLEVVRTVRGGGPVEELPRSLTSVK